MKLPEGWIRQSLAQISHGGLFRDGDWVESKDQDPTGGVRLTQLADVGVGYWRDRSDRWLREDQASRLRCTFLRPRDVLIARMPDPLGRSCLVPENIGRAVTVVDVALLRVARADVDPGFVMWAMNAPEAQASVVTMQSGTTRKRVSRKNLATVQISLPPLREQRRVVEILEGHLSSLDAVRSATAASRVQLEALRRSVITHIRPVETTRVRLNEVLTLTIGGIWGRAPGEDQRDVDVYRVTELREFGELAPTSTRRSISLRQYESRALQSGDLLLEKSGGGPTTPVGRVGLIRGIKQPSVCANFMQLMRPDRSRVRPEYLHLALNDLHDRGQTRALQTASTNIRNIKASDYLQLAIDVPLLEEQDRILAAMGQLSANAVRLRVETDIADRRVSALRRALFIAAFSGQLTGKASDFDRAEESIAS